MYKTFAQIKMCMDLSPITLYTSCPSDGSIVKILPARGTRQRKFEFGDPPNQELNKIIRLKETRIQKLMCQSQRRLQDVYSVSTTRRLQC